MKYFTPEEIKNRHEEIHPQQEHVSWGVRTGKAINLVTEHVNDPEARILDCATGSGNFLTQLSQNGFRNIYGLDIDDYRREPAKKFEFKTSDVCLRGIPWPENYFSAVTSLQTIEHLENPYYFIREVSRVLKPGGVFIASIPNPYHILSRLLYLVRGNLYHWLESDNHITFFTKATFKKAFLTNFELLKIEYAKPEFKYKFFNRWRWLWRWLPANQWFGRYVYFVLRKPERVA